MNVRVNPPVRCSYDVAEHVLRIITQEPKAEGLTGEKDPTSELEIVVYAMKVRFFLLFTRDFSLTVTCTYSPVARVRNKTLKIFPKCSLRTLVWRRLVPPDI